MAPFQGFAHDTRYAPVPTPLLGALLQEVDSLEELKCTLRVMGLVHHRRSRRLWVGLSELMADTILLDAFAQEPGGASEAIRRGIQQAVERGTLLQAQQSEAGQSETLLFINDEPGRQAMATLDHGLVAREIQEPVAGQGASGPRPSIFALYEDNIGPLTPLLAEELKEAESTYPWTWIEEAFREAVSLNRRSWRYIARILQRWEREGKQDGEPGRHSQTVDRKEFLRDYLRRRGHLAR